MFRPLDEPVGKVGENSKKCLRVSNIRRKEIKNEEFTCIADSSGMVKYKKHLNTQVNIRGLKQRSGPKREYKS